MLLHMDHTLDEADVLMIFGDLEVKKLSCNLLMKMNSLQNVVVHEQQTTCFQPVSHIMDDSACAP